MIFFILCGIILLIYFRRCYIVSDYLHLSHGNDSQNKELLTLLDKIFKFPNERVKDFMTLLPKLYKDKYHPAQNNIILDVDGDMRAAVGVYYNTITVGDKCLKTAGIGNVGTHPDFEGNGYMRFCMALALDEMKQNMTDIAFLGGARQRYAHHGFEPAGVRYEFTFNKDNVKRKFLCEKKSKFTAIPLDENNSEFINKITENFNNRVFKWDRTADNMFDTLKNWNSNPYVIMENDTFKGWVVFSTLKNSVYEIGFENKEDIEDIIICALETSGHEAITLTVAPCEVELADYLGLNCEHYNVGHCEMFNILCYENVIRAFLKYKSTYTKLSDGELNLLIEGCKLTEQIKISVKDNCVTVCETEDKPDFILKHNEAIRLFGSIYSETRNKLPCECANWFPLPLFISACDTV